MNHAELTENNRRIVDGLYAAALRGDFVDLTSRLDENVLVHEPPFLPYGGIYKGVDGFMKELLPAIMEYLDVPSLKIPYLVADGERVIGCLTFREKKTGNQLCLLEQSTLRDGKIIEMKIFYFDAGLLIAGAK